MATILIVDDEPLILEMVHDLLADDEHEVLAAENSADALEIFGLSTLDLVVSDVELGREYGPNLVARMREDRPDLKAIFMSGRILEEDGRLVTGSGREFVLSPDDFFCKADDPKELREKVRKKLSG